MDKGWKSPLLDLVNPQSNLKQSHKINYIVSFLSWSLGFPSAVFPPPTLSFKKKKNHIKNILMDKEVGHIYNRIWLDHKKEWSLSLWMDLEAIVLREISQQRKASGRWFHLNVKSKKINNLKNELTKQKHKIIDTENIWTFARWESGWGMGEKTWRD